MKKIFKYSLIALSPLILSDCKTIKIMKVLTHTTFSEKHFKKEIPFQRIARLIAVKAGLNGGLDKYDFIFDTGAGTTVISKKIADSLVLKKVGKLNVKDSRGNSQVYELVLVKELDMNGLKFYNFGAVIADFGKNSILGCIDGIIGVNLIAVCNWTVDYQNNTITATDSNLNFPPDAVSIPFTSAIPYIDMQIGHTVLHHVMVDLGSNESITIPTSVLNKNPGLHFSRVYLKTDAGTEGLNGTRLDTVKIFKGDSVNLAGHLYSDVYITSSKDDLLKIGTDFWDKNLVGLDYKDNRILLVKNTVESQKNMTKGFGFRIAIKDGKYLVNVLFDNSPAAKAGIKMSDEVLEINGKPVTDFFKDYCDALIWEMDSMDMQEQISVKLKRTGETIVLKNEDYGTAPEPDFH